MKGYYLKKVLSALLVLFIIITLNFFLPRMIFSDPAQPYFVGVPEDAIALRNQIREQYGFNEPIFVQYLAYLGRVATLDFGQSHYYKESVWSVMFSRIPWSMVLTVSSMLLSVLFGIIFGAAAGRRRDKGADKVLLWFSGITTAIPSFWLAMVAVMLFGFTLKMFPYRGAMTAGYTLVMDGRVFAIVFGVCILCAVIARVLTKKSLFAFLGIPVSLIAALFASVPVADIADVAYHAALPVMISVFSGIISYGLLVRNSMIAVTNEDYILTARAKGLPPHVVLYKHTFRNALLPLITNVGMSMSGLLGGSVLMEKIFSWPGMILCAAGCGAQDTTTETTLPVESGDAAVNAGELKLGAYAGSAEYTQGDFSMAWNFTISFLEDGTFTLVNDAAEEKGAGTWAKTDDCYTMTYTDERTCTFAVMADGSLEIASVLPYGQASIEADKVGGIVLTYAGEDAVVGVEGETESGVAASGDFSIAAGTYAASYTKESAMAGTVVYEYTAQIGDDGTFSYAVTFAMGDTVYDGCAATGTYTAQSGYFVFTDSEGNVTEGVLTADNTLVISLMASQMAKDPYEVTFTPAA